MGISQYPTDDITQIITSYLHGYPVTNINGCYQYGQYTQVMNSVFKRLQLNHIYVDVLRVMESIDDYYVLKHKLTIKFEEEKIEKIYEEEYNIPYRTRLQR